MLYYEQYGYLADSPNGRPTWTPFSESQTPLLSEVPLYRSPEEYQSQKATQSQEVNGTIVYHTSTGYTTLQPVRWRDIVRLANHVVWRDQYWITPEVVETVALLQEHYGTDLEQLAQECDNPEERTLVEEFLWAVRDYCK